VHLSGLPQSTCLAVTAAPVFVDPDYETVVMQEFMGFDACGSYWP
jgi:hypothetical protein